MNTVNKISVSTLLLAILQVSACTPHHAAPSRLAMHNPASDWCVQRGGQPLQASSSSGSVSYCLLPSGEKIEQWALFHRDHPQ